MSFPWKRESIRNSTGFPLSWEWQWGLVITIKLKFNNILWRSIQHLIPLSVINILRLVLWFFLFGLYGSWIIQVKKDNFKFSLCTLCLNIKYPEQSVISTISSIIASGIVRLINPPKHPHSSIIIPFAFTYTRNTRKNTKTLKTNRMAVARNRFVSKSSARAISTLERMNIMIFAEL